MNDRERFLAVMQYQPVDRLPLMLFEPYEQYGVEQWRGEGLPVGVSPDVHFGIGRVQNAPQNLGPIPAFDERVLSETEAEVVQLDWLWGDCSPAEVGAHDVLRVYRSPGEELGGLAGVRQAFRRLGSRPHPR